MEPLQHYRARWVLPVDRPPIAGGVVAVSGGRILEVSSQTCPDAVDLGHVALVPGFVNAHAHLDLSACMRPTPPASFADWLAGVVKSRRQQDAAAQPTILREAIGQLIVTGTTLVGDVTTTTATPELLDAAALPAVVFMEVLGHRPLRYEPLWQAAVACSESWRQSKGQVAVGISPHAPYSASRAIYGQCGDLAAEIPRATHWLETREEIEFLATTGGPLREFLETMGAFDEALAGDWPANLDPWNDWLLADPVGRWVLIHCNYLASDDIERMSREPIRGRVAGVVFCPRTHAYFGHPPHPWRQLQTAGIPVGLGTDSLASNPDLAVFNEARFLAADDAHVAPSALLRLLTIEGATVLGRGNVTGTITRGKRADFAIVELPASGNVDVYAALFSPQARVVGTVIGGNWQWLQGPLADIRGLRQHPGFNVAAARSRACNGTSAD